MGKSDDNTAEKAVDYHGLVRLFVVLYDDKGGLQCPMMWDADCEGALTAWWHPNPIATFPSRADARKAITISTKYAQLVKAQGKPENTDFTEFKKHLRVEELCLPNKQI
ncbi:MAG: hypothetical protein AAF555_05760 [Verrucomicrobiota bacterium]